MLLLPYSESKNWQYKTPSDVKKFDIRIADPPIGEMKPQK